MNRAKERLTAGLRRLAAGRVESLDWWLNPVRTPSFVNAYSNFYRVYSAALDQANQPWGSLWDWETKTGVRALATQVGVATPEIFQGPVPVGDIEFHRLPEKFVIKPVRGAAKTGVYVLNRQGSGFVDLLRKRRIINQRQLVAEVLDCASRGEISGNEMIAEEALTRGPNDISYDWKVYAFQGETPLICQISRTFSGREDKYYGGDWVDLGRVRYAKPAVRHLPLPELPDHLLGAAASLSRAVPVPFVRVDLYESRGQVYLGELTPAPGSGQRYQRWLDIEMGRAWQRAEATLFARSAARDRKDDGSPAV